MRARSFLFALAALSVFAACNPTAEPEVPVVLEVSGVKDNAIAVAAEGQTVKVTVVSNFSWEVTCDADWVSVDPAKVDVEENKETSTKVTITVAKSEVEQARSANVKFSAGKSSIDIVVNQAAFVPEPSTIVVLDSDLEPVADYSITAKPVGGEVSFVVKSNVSWTATAPEWVTLDPASVESDGEYQNKVVNATFAANTSAERSGKIVLSSDKVSLEIPVSQPAVVTFQLNNVTDPKYNYILADFEVVPSSDIVWDYQLYKAGTVEQYGEDAVIEDILAYGNQFLSQASPEDIMAQALYYGKDTLNLEDLPAETALSLCIVGVEYSKSEGAFVASTSLKVCNFTTAATPKGSAEYEKYLGTYKTTVWDYFDEKNVESTIVVMPKYIDEVYKFYFAEGFTPISQSSGLVDTFGALLDTETGNFVIPNAQVGSAGERWNFGDPIGIGAVALVMEVYDPTDSKGGEFYNQPEYVSYTLSDDGKLKLVDLQIPEGYLYEWSSSIVQNQGGQYTTTGYATGVYDFKETTDWVKAVASSSIKSVEPAKLNTLQKKSSLEKDTVKKFYRK